MAYRVEFLPRAADDIKRLDRVIAQRVLTRIKWLSDNLNAITTEVLTGDLKGLLKFRAGSYRVLYTVNQKERAIIIHLIGHRKDIYR